MATSDLESIYKKYVSFGSTATAQKKELTSANFMKMMKEANLISGKLTRTDIDIIFTKSKIKGEKFLSYKQFKDVALKEIAKVKYGSDEPEKVEKLIGILTSGSGPQTVGATKQAKNKATDRLTDTSKYTGSHKERFDEDGKGRGIGGRKDLHAEKGYVHGYKHDGTYDQSH